MFSRVAVGLLILAVSTNLVLSCPNSCLCITQYEGVIIHCNGTGLTDIPRNIPNDAYAIHMDKNPITIIENGTFQNMTSLHTLNLYGCNITTIETNAFINLPNLQYFELSNNRITTLQKERNIPRPTSTPNTVLWRDNDIKGLLTFFCRNVYGNNLILIKNDTFEHNINLNFLTIDFVCDCNVAFRSWISSKMNLFAIINCLDRNDIDLSSLQASYYDNCNAKEEIRIAIVVNVLGKKYFKKTHKKYQKFIQYVTVTNSLVLLVTLGRLVPYLIKWARPLHNGYYTYGDDKIYVLESVDHRLHWNIFNKEGFYYLFESAVDRKSQTKGKQQ
ncbi:unnamed protein product [Mytilus coruscus]|uniref:LRRNT domain-containing protein n=1 Tax=Mytilus coruscus TaxID=42192 RepID=A0A6J8A044_MYTCO|nr:unnamed protein product [Mytilus coruscus]